MSWCRVTLYFTDRPQKRALLADCLVGPFDDDNDDDGVINYDNAAVSATTS